MHQTGLPIFQHNYPSGICDQILWLVKNSNLNFSAQETPFSLNLSLKKRFVKKWPDNGDKTAQTNNVSEELVYELEAKDRHIQNLEKTVKSLSEQLSKDNLDTIVEDKVKYIVDEKRALQVKHERLCAENKIIKGENEIFRKNLNNVHVALKSSRKETKDLSYKSEKKLEGLEDKIKELYEYKIRKESEERALSYKTKKAEKKLKKIREKEAKSEMSKVAPEDVDNSNNNKSTNKPAEKDSDEIIACVSTENMFDILSENRTIEEDIIKNETEIDDNVSDDSGEEFECVICDEMFTSEKELIIHRREHAGKNYNCKLCDKSYATEEDFRIHRSTLDHKTLSDAVLNEFRLQIGNNCDCEISERQLNTMYYFCESEEHYEMFQQIWSKIFSNNHQVNIEMEV